MFVKLTVPVEHAVSIHDARPNQNVVQPLAMIVCSNKVKLVEKVTAFRKSLTLGAQVYLKKSTVVQTMYEEILKLSA